MNSATEGIYQPTGSNGYCGPYVLSALTGFTTDDVAKTIRDLTGRRYVKFVRSSEIGRTLAAYGLKYEHRQYGDRPLSEWLGYDRRPEGTYIVLASRHFVLVHEGMVYDNGCWGCSEGMDLETFRRRHGRKRVKRVWEVR